ncbi:hypothetical protein MPRM_29100 [Mycobacterium parmense]|uniref:Uncharacterized protein n=1 Tax=Mycobacterium parmense TaxID=185642 RepID=A0A7I7YVC7_9MYCO|nr:hypothetical protein MPRM_29100 [Mycobacterium parmense]
MFAPPAASAVMNGADLLPMMLDSERFSSITTTTCASCGMAAALRSTRGASGVAAKAASAKAPARRRT